MMILQDLLNEAEKRESPQDLCKKAIETLISRAKSHRLGKRADYEDPRTERNGMAVGIRYWGVWIDRRDTDFDDAHPSKETEREMMKIIKEVQKMPQFKKVKIDVRPSEKCWIELTAHPK